MESVCTLDTLSSESFFFGFVTMHETTTRSATRPPLRASGGGGSFSANARRRIRQAVALGTELDLHSVKRACGIVMDAATFDKQATQRDRE